MEKRNKQKSSKEAKRELFLKLDGKTESLDYISEAVLKEPAESKQYHTKLFNYKA